MKRHRKKLLKILLPFLVLLLGGGGFCVYWFVIRKSNDEISVKYNVKYKSISAISTTNNSTSLTVEYSGVKWKDISWKEYSTLPSEYEWDRFLKLEGLQNKGNNATSVDLTISFRDDFEPPGNLISFNFWLIAKVSKYEFKSPEISCYFRQRDINSDLFTHTIPEFYSPPSSLDVIKAFFAFNNVNPQADWDLSSWEEVSRYVSVSLNVNGALMTINSNPFFTGQTQIYFAYPQGRDINTVITNKDLGEFIKEPNRQDIRLLVQAKNTAPTLGGWDLFWSEMALSDPNNNVCYIVSFGQDYYGSLAVRYGVI
ncbi:MAG: hypothetical protein LBD63_01000 [Mycoplasmataceae bacterium]|nr:hypothetical protein [Mycoplasmataceae bacterium]